MQSGDWPLIFVLHAETYSLRTVITNVQCRSKCEDSLSWPCSYVASFPGSPEREMYTRARINSISRSGAEEPGNEASSMLCEKNFHTKLKYGNETTTNCLRTLNCTVCCCQAATSPRRYIISRCCVIMNFSVDSLDQVGGAGKWDVVGSTPVQARGRRKAAERNDYDRKY